MDKPNVNRNEVKVANQYVPGGGTYANRYDVTKLVKGLPLVRVELKRRGGAERRPLGAVRVTGYSLTVPKCLRPLGTRYASHATPRPPSPQTKRLLQWSHEERSDYDIPFSDA